MKARPYQNESVKSILAKLRAHPSTLLVLATGLGKTVVFSSVAKLCLQKGKRCLVIAHREELIWQAAEKLEAITGERPDIEMGEFRAADSLMGKAKIVVATVQTLNAGSGEGRMSRFDFKEFGLIITDEAHRATSPTYRAIYDRAKAENPVIKMLFVTATPDRLDGEALGQVCESTAFEYGALDGIRDGWLCPIEQRYVEVEGLDYSGIKTVGGDLSAGQLAAVMEREKNLQEIASATVQIAKDRKTLIFAASVAQAEHLTEILNRHELGSARLLTGTTNRDVRRDMLKDYREGRFSRLVNVGVAVEGFDVPGIEVVVMATATKSRAKYAQMVGRGTRPLPGTIDGPHTEHWGPSERRQAIAASAKAKMLVLDFKGNAGKHKLVHATNALAGNISERVLKRAEKLIESGKVREVTEAISQAERDEMKAQEAEAQRRRSGVVGTAKFKTEAISPFDIFGTLPTREAPWHKGKMATEKQVATLLKFKVRNPEQLTLTQAKALLDKLFHRREQGLCTYAQAQILKKYGIKTDDLTIGEAKGLIDEIASNGWKKPAGGMLVAR